MKKSYIVTALIVSVVAIGALILLTQKDNVPTTQNSTNSQTAPTTETENTATTSEHVIIFTDSGFSPAELTINQGATVVFKNQSSSVFQPASDQHPTHTAYSEFDPRRGIESGGEYSFTFERTGTWGYHDHLNPAHVGTITVR